MSDPVPTTVHMSGDAEWKFPAKVIVDEEKKRVGVELENGQRWMAPVEDVLLALEYSGFFRRRDG